MLVEFNVSNFRSIYEKQTLSMVSGSGKEKLENTFTPDNAATPNLLKSSVIYGPNASGKSNLITALHEMQSIVLQSARSGQEGDKIDYEPFLLNTTGKLEPTEFEVIFVEAGVRYQYGFSFNEDHIEEEWLIAYPTNKAQRWFHRLFIPKDSSYEWYFGPKFTGPKKLHQNATRKNALFLSTAVQLNSDILKAAFSWFGNRLTVIPLDQDFSNRLGGFTTRQCLDSEQKEKILSFLQQADLGIQDIQVEIKKVQKEDLPNDLPQEFSKALLGQEISRIEFIHEISDGQSVRFSIEQESDGTKKMFELSGIWMDVLSEGKIIIIDEFDNSLHQHLLNFLIHKIHAQNPKGAQLIFTTHNVNLMEGNFRRDQFWFVERNRNNESRLYPLSKFSVRKGEAIKNNYLRGSYGAIPIIDED